MVDAFRQAGYDHLGFTDHFADSSFGRFEMRIDECGLEAYVQAARAARVVVGLEVEILEDGCPAIKPEQRRQVDYSIGGLHRVGGVRFFEDPTPIADEQAYVQTLKSALLGAIRSGLIDAIAHPTKLPEALREHADELLDECWRTELISTAVRHGVAFDLNEDSRVPDATFVAACRHAGARILIGSDAHSLAEARPLAYVAEVCQQAGIRPEDLYIPATKTRR
ncbi:MAG: hypothetical protein ACYDAG_00995, partial [Chloroflexota bacterium]